jgi:hypothetical protein
MSTNTLTAVEQADLLRYAASLPEESGTRWAVLASLSRIAAGTEDDIRRHLPALKQGYEGYVQAIRDMEARAMPGDSDYARHAANRPWLVIINNGTKVVAGILSVRSIPDKGAKPLEMVYRLMNNSRRMPQDIYKWWNDNGKRVNFLIEAAESWPAKTEGTDELFTLGPFKVHNTVGAKGAELESLKKGLERVEKAIKPNPIPGFARVLYGDVHVVPRITKGHHAAWYYPSDDSVYLRRTKSTGMDEVHALIHELGHRYWHKFASEPQKKAWGLQHIRAGVQPVEVELPKVGEEIPVAIKGVKNRYPTITLVEPGRLHYTIDIEGRPYTNSISTRQVYDFFHEKQKRTKNFPTPYSATDAQEHFCDSLAMLAMGNLPDEFAVPFNAIWNP